jgi:rhodanese-related sulfurtransferase
MKELRLMTDVDPPELLERIAGSAPPVILDVRSRTEFAAGHIPGSIHIPFWAVAWRTGELRAAPDDPIVVYCGHGPRALFARSALRRRGFTRVACLAGHMSKWRQAGYPEDF